MSSKNCKKCDCTICEDKIECHNKFSENHLFIWCNTCKNGNKNLAFPIKNCKYLKDWVSKMTKSYKRRDYTYG